MKTKKQTNKRTEIPLPEAQEKRLRLLSKLRSEWDQATWQAEQAGQEAEEALARLAKAEVEIARARRLEAPQPPARKTGMDSALRDIVRAANVPDDEEHPLQKMKTKKQTEFSLHVALARLADALRLVAAEVEQALDPNCGDVHDSVELSALIEVLSGKPDDYECPPARKTGVGSALHERVRQASARDDDP